MIKKIAFENDLGLKLKGNLHLNNESKKIVILLHGFGGTKEGIPRIISNYLSDCYNSFRFDFTGNGASQGDRIISGTFSQAISDVKSAIDFLERLGFKEFVLVGHSMGGAVAICSEEKRASAVIAIATPCHTKQFPIDILGKELFEKLKQLKEIEIYLGFEKIKLTLDFFLDAMQYDVIESSKKVKKLLLIHGTEDEKVPFRHAKKIQLASGCDLISIPGATHNFLGEAMDKLLVALKNWLLRNF